jgi:hypothetical protein
VSLTTAVTDQSINPTANKGICYLRSVTVFCNAKKCNYCFLKIIKRALGNFTRNSDRTVSWITAVRIPAGTEYILPCSDVPIEKSGRNVNLNLYDGHEGRGGIKLIAIH